jgi:GNAT superfamily N-acetyltransferase
MLVDDFDETFDDNPQDKVPNQYITKLLKIIADETAKYKEYLYFCKTDDSFIGFSAFQIDTLDNPLCKREGWGFIREFYIIPEQRRKGYAKRMCEFVEDKLLQFTNNIYLTSDPYNGIPFWEAMGYIYSGQIDDKNGLKIYVKHRLV